MRGPSSGRRAPVACRARPRRIRQCRPTAAKPGRDGTSAAMTPPTPWRLSGRVGGAPARAASRVDPSDRAGPRIIEPMAPSLSAESLTPGPLVGTKLRAPVEVRDYRERPRLSAQLDGALEDRTRLTLLSAPPGYGKTMAVAGWLATRGMPVAWLSLDPADNDLARFARYLAAALRSVRPDAEAATMGLFGPGTNADHGPRRGHRRRGHGGQRRAIRAGPRRLPRRHGGADPASRPLPDRARPAVRPSRPPDARGSPVAARPPAGSRPARRAAGRRPALHGRRGVGLHRRRRHRPRARPRRAARRANRGLDRRPPAGGHLAPRPA